MKQAVIKGRSPGKEDSKQEIKVGERTKNVDKLRKNVDNSARMCKSIPEAFCPFYLSTKRVDKLSTSTEDSR
jgi:hypothetical protein